MLMLGKTKGFLPLVSTTMTKPATGQGFDRRAIPAAASESVWHAKDGHEIRHIDWPAPPANVPYRGSMLFMAGRGDAYEKYIESFEHWRLRGWQVSAADWRGQGGSGRLGLDDSTGHIDDFALWITDLADFWRKWAEGREGPLALMGHSMGGLLIMETLRQIALSGDRALLDRLSATTLISPDIDMDLFRAQAHALGHLPQPFTVAIAQNDRLLRLSSGLSGGAARLGSVEDLDQLEGLGVFVVDMTGIADTGSNHFLPGTSASAIALIKGLRDADALAPQSLSVGPVSIKLGG